MKYYILVRHTGYSIGKKPAFKNAVEVRNITVNQKQFDVLLRNRVMLFSDYSTATEKEEKINYPHEGNFIIPSANMFGSFALIKGSGIKEEVFIPF